MNRRRVLTLTVSAMAMALASACGGGSGKAITVVIAEYSKDHTKPFWQGLAEQYTKQTGVKVDLRVIDWNSIDQQVSTMIQNNQRARRPEPELVLQLRQGRPALPGGRRPVAEDEGRFPRAIRERRRVPGHALRVSDPVERPRVLLQQRSPGERRRRRAAQDVGRVRAGGRRRIQSDRRDRLCAAARTRGSAGRVGHLDVEQRRRLEDGRRLGDQQRQERPDAVVPGRPRQQAEGHPGESRQDQPHRRRLPALQGRQGRHGHGLQPARRASSTRRAR